MKIKSSWDEVTLEDYLFIQSVLMEDGLEEFEKQVRIICLLSGVEEDYFNDYTLTEISQVFNSLAFITEEPKGDIQDIYVVNGKEYRLTKSIKSLKANQWKDLNHFIKDPDEILNNLHSICGILLLPTKKLPRKHRLFNRFLRLAKTHVKGLKWIQKKGIVPILPQSEKYMESAPEERAEIFFKHLSVTQAMGIVNYVFFCSILYAECLVDYMNQETKAQLKSVLKSLSEEPSLMNRTEIQMMKNSLEALEVIGDGQQ